MNKFLLAMMCIPAITTQSLSVNAQQLSRTHKLPKSPLDHLAPCHNPRSAAKTTAAQARLIASANLTYNGTDYTVDDSSTFKYLNGRGSTFNNNYFNQKFDSAVNYINFGSSYNVAMRAWQTFDAQNNLLTYTDQEWISWLGSWRNYYNEINTYDAANNILTYTSQDWDTSASAWVNNYKTTNTYTAANKIATMLWQSWNATSGVWVDGFRSTNTYDASNFLVSTVAEMWNASTSSWDSVYRSTFTNDAAGNPLTEISQNWNGTTGMWDNQSRYTYTYDASNNLLTELTEAWSAISLTWDSSSRTIYSGYTGTNAATIVSQFYNTSSSSFVNSNRDNYTFNSYNQPTFYYNESWNSTTSNWQRTATSNFGERYHYEIYAVGTPNLTGINGKASIYPVPARDAISVSVSWNEPQAFTISITDMLGRVINTSAVTECSSYSGVIPVNDLAAGNYIIKMEGANGKLTQRFVVEK